MVRLLAAAPVKADTGVKIAGGVAGIQGAALIIAVLFVIAALDGGVGGFGVAAAGIVGLGFAPVKSNPFSGLAGVISQLAHAPHQAVILGAPQGQVVGDDIRGGEHGFAYARITAGCAA